MVDAGDGLPLTVPDLLRQRASTRRDHLLLVCDNDVLTYSEADARSAALAKGLLASGAGKGTHIGILHPNGSEFVVSWLAAARIGALSVPISTFSTAAELRALLRAADVEILLSTHSFRHRDYLKAVLQAVPGLTLDTTPPLFDSAVPALRLVAFSDADVAPIWTSTGLVERGTRLDDGILAAVEDTVRPSDRMVIVHTSGSTSTPKGVIHQNGPLIRHIDSLNRIRRYSDADVLFSNSPFFWIGGFAYCLLGTLLAGATLVCSNAQDAAGVLDVLERSRPTMVNGFAATVAHLAHDPSFATRDLSSISRGNLWPIMPPETRPSDPELRHNMLGMTEAGSVCLVSEDETDQPEHRRGSFGKPAPGFEAAIMDPDTGRRCGDGDVGELWLRGQFLMEGYYGRERQETFEPDGWYRTGDLMHVDDEGFYYFTGRLSDMIKTAGANVSPREVEAAILEVSGLPSHVVGVDDADRGQLVAAVIRISPGHPPPDVDELRRSLRLRLSAYKVPLLVLLRSDAEIPMLSSGKIDTRALKAMFKND